MKGQVLIKNSGTYTGKYIAIKSVTDKTVLASGDTIDEAFDGAKEKGENDPFIVYINGKETKEVSKCG